jgi:hypothetical protein
LPKIGKPSSGGMVQDREDFELRFLLKTLESESKNQILPEAFCKFPSIGGHKAGADADHRAKCRQSEFDQMPMSLPMPQLYIPRNRAASRPHASKVSSLESQNIGQEYRAVFNRLIGPHAHL